MKSDILWFYSIDNCVKFILVKFNMDFIEDGIIYVAIYQIELYDFYCES